MSISHERNVKKQAAIQRHRRELWVIENGPCQLCASWENLEVDHRDPDDKFSHRIWSYSEEKRLAELAKCRVLCRECHVKRHAEEKIVHGTRNRYEMGCRCGECRIGYLKARREQRERAKTTANAGSRTRVRAVLNGQKSIDQLPLEDVRELVRQRWEGRTI
jgi:hypothetical protein